MVRGHQSSVGGFTGSRRVRMRVSLVRSARLRPVGCQNSATGFDLGFYAAGWYSLMRSLRTGRRLIRSWERSAAGWSVRGGRSRADPALVGAADPVAAALVVGLALPAAGSASNGGTHHTFRVVAITTELNLLDLGAKGPSLHGDAQSRDW